GFNSALMF
nr:SALMFamide 1 [Asterias rubens]